jgi:hypothetical protein
MPAKDNQPTLLANIQELLELSEQAASKRTQAQDTASYLSGPGPIRAVGDDLCWPEVQRHTTVECRHGRVERRHLSTVSLPPGQRKRIDWPQWAQVYRIERHTASKRTGKVRYEVCYGITSLEPEVADAAQLMTYTRGHWTIENRSHWVRDVTYAEDQSTVRVSEVAQIMAGLRNTAISLMRCAGHTNLAKACRYYAANPRQALQLLGAT